MTVWLSQLVEQQLTTLALTPNDSMWNGYYHQVEPDGFTQVSDTNQGLLHQYIPNNFKIEHADIAPVVAVHYVDHYVWVLLTFGKAKHIQM